MDDQTLRNILSRLQALERDTVRYRQGEITDISPLSVALGGSDVPLDAVKALDAHGLEEGDVVAALTWARDLLVLGRVGDGEGTYIPIARRSGRLDAAGGNNSVFMSDGSIAGAADARAGTAAFYINPAEGSGIYRLRLTIATNNTAPGWTDIFARLFTVSGAAGGAAAVTLTLAGGTPPQAGLSGTVPANVLRTYESDDFTLTADYYALGLLHSAAMTAGSSAALTAELLQKN